MSISYEKMLLHPIWLDAAVFLYLFMIPAVAVRPAGSQGVLALKVACTTGFTHGVVQTAHGGGQVIQPQLPHQGADAAFRKPAFIALVIRVGEELHVPGIGVAVGGFQGGGGLHPVNIRLGKF